MARSLAARFGKKENKNPENSKSVQKLRSTPRRRSSGYQQYIEAMEDRTLMSTTLTGAINTPLGTAPSNLVIADFNNDGRLDIATAAVGVDVRLGNGDGTFSGPTSNLQSLAITGGLVAGDFNGDGNVDLVAIDQGSATGTPMIHTLLGNGNGTFNATTATQSFPTGFAPPIAVDVNGDGKLDLVAVNSTAGTVGVLLGNGDGTFENIATYSAVTNVRSVAAADFNSDGKIDLVVNGNSTALLFGNGDGTFGSPVTIAASAIPTTVAAGDLNGDGKADIVTGNILYVGNGDGTFQSTTLAISEDSNVTLADMNNDGVPDLVASTATGVGIALNNGDGTFRPETNYADSSANYLSIGDFNGDGNLDLMGANIDTETATVVPGNGDGTLLAASIIPSGDVSNPIPGLTATQTHPSEFFGDFNGDGIQDFAVANTGADTISISFGNADGTFQAPISFVPQTLGQAPRPQIVTVSDFNGDGKDDLIIYTPGLPETVTLGGGENHGAGGISGGTPASWTLFLSNGDGTFTPSTISNPLFVPNASELTVGNVDLDGDGIPDVIVASSEFGPFSTTPVGLLTIEYTTAATKIASQQFLLGGDPNAVYTPDLNGDGLPDILITSNESNIVWTLLNTGDGFVIAGNPNAAVTQVTLPDGSSAPSMDGYVAYAVPAGAPLDWLGTSNLKFGDFNQDGKPDIAVSTALGQVSILLGNGDGTFQPGQTFDVGGQSQNLAIADFNGDGFPDVAALIGNQTAIALNTGFDAEQLGTAVGFRLSAPATSAAGQTNSVTVIAVDANGNPVPDFLGTIHLTSNDPKATLPMFYTFTAADAGTHTFPITLDKSGADVVTASNPRLASGSTTISVAAGAAVGFSVSAPTQTVAGVAFNVVVSARDKFGNLAPTYTSTIDFSSDDPRATLPASFTFTAADAGIYTFPITLIQAQTYSAGGFFKIMPGTFFPPQGPMVTVTDETNATITGSGGSTVVAAPLAQINVLAISGNPIANSIIAGQPIEVSVTAFDAFGNLQVFPTGDVIHVASTDPHGNAPANIVVPGLGINPLANVSVEWSNGSNDQLFLTTAGPQTITVTDLSQPAITGNTSITVVAAPAVKLAVSFAANASAGTPTAMTVTALDQFGNIDTGYNGVLHFSSSDPAAILPADSDLTPAENGTHTFMVTLKTLGAQTVSVHDLTSFTVPTTIANTTVILGPPSVFTVTPIASAMAGVAQSFSVTVKDAAGDILKGYTGTLLFSSTDVQAGLPANYKFTAADAGTHIFSATFKTSGVQSINFHDSAIPTLSGTTGNTTVAAGAATHFVLSGAATATTGKATAVTVTALDAFGNIATGYRGKVHFTDTLSAGLPSDYTFTATDSGVHTFNVTLSTVGLQTLKLTDTAVSQIFGTINITASAVVSGGGGTATGGGATGGGATGGGGGGGKTA
jgi:FG-GAP-like repeat/FG-GAP repeat